MWLDVVLELLGAAVEFLFHGGWKNRKRRRKRKSLDDTSKPAEGAPDAS